VYRSKYIVFDVDRSIKNDAHKLMVVADQYGVVVRARERERAREGEGVRE
jgi:hypothetical protein